MLNQQKIAQQRDMRRNEKSKIKEAIEFSKREEARLLKDAARSNMQKKSQHYVDQRETNAQRMRWIRQQELEQKRRKEDYRLKKMLDTRLDVEKQIVEEEQIIAQKEEEVRQMELLEMQLIKKLQST